MANQRKKINGVWHIRRSGYTRKRYTKADGTTVKATKVPAAWIVDRGKPGKGPKLITIKGDDSLKKYGYSLKIPASRRHTALNKAMKAYGYGTTVKKVNALSILLKNTSPTYAARAKSDVKYMKRKKVRQSNVQSMVV